MSSTAVLHGPRARWRRRLLAVAASSALAAGGLTVLAPPASAEGVCAAPVLVGATTTITCSAGGSGSVTVPDGVSVGVVTLDGAGGGNAADGTAGGKGAHLVATVPATPGQTFNVTVGRRGANGTASAQFGVPGSGGALVAVTTAANAPLLTAGSGGGAGGAGIGSPAYRGAAGGDSGSAGADGNGLVPDAQGGTGGGPGTDTAGGAAGIGGAGADNEGPNGSPGAFPNGSGGAAGQGVFSPTGAGGRGGAGYGGGGRGGAGGRYGSTGGGGGGGGGGSSLVSGTVPGSSVTLTEGANAGDGRIVFAFTLPPTVTSVGPAAGPTGGGTAVTVTGTNLSGAVLTFGADNPATDVTCTATSCTATAPAGTGTVDVRATTPGGTSAPSPAGRYTYVPVPVVTSLSPAVGTTAGGTVVTVGGTGLDGATAVTFGPGNPGTGLSCTPTACTATAPAHAAGPVDVQVTTPGGTSAVTGAGRYTYQLPPADIDVDLTAQPGFSLLVPYLTYTLTARNTGPGTVTSATLTATLPSGASANTLSPGCTAAGSTVTCAYGTIANGATATKTFRVPLGLLSLGRVTVSATRTASAPTDPNPLNDSASASCTVVSVLLATCP
ncbi:IPT/TIG domain-containing protein [Streptomyces sp. ZAF1911]|uniref:IPT/TIG domain-containing protein n=1 Tax=Streptomyces sp. ZAF1911 TaxID=2944129 RepID=UPI00237B2768|nr:IPT/TIG domain-containing protein [Streptomyces sp. ZAF1911]MDD9380953.1 IPT/TIG domain-containing protein [Streptomyces sp. ZAF1911]